MASIWHYQDDPKSYRGYHYHGSHDLLANAVERCRQYSKGTVSLSPPSSDNLSIAGCKKDIDSWFAKCRLQSSGRSGVSVSADTILISLNDDAMNGLADALLAYKTGENDFSVPLGDTCLWFW